MTFGAGEAINFLDWLKHPQAAMSDERSLVDNYIRNWSFVHRDFKDALAQASSSFAQREAIRSQATAQCEPIVLGELTELWAAYANECHMSRFSAHRTAANSAEGHQP